MSTVNNLEFQVDNIVKALVTKPEDVVIKSDSGERMVTITISAAKEDIGKIIGKKGYTISVIRNIMQLIAAAHEKRINIVVLD